MFDSIITLNLGKNKAKTIVYFWFILHFFTYLFMDDLYNYETC